MYPLIVFFVGMGGGGMLELLYAHVHTKILGKPFRINHHLTLAKKLSIYSLPIWGLLALLVANDFPSTKLFIYSAIVGTIFEFATGFVLYLVFGVRVWTYKYGSLGKFTSIYSIPYWGGAGIIFATLARIIG